MKVYLVMEEDEVHYVVNRDVISVWSSEDAAKQEMEYIESKSPQLFRTLYIQEETVDPHRYNNTSE